MDVNWNYRTKPEVASVLPIHLTASIQPERDKSLLIIHSFVLAIPIWHGPASHPIPEEPQTKPEEYYTSSGYHPK